MRGYQTKRRWNNDAIHATCDAYIASHYGVASIGRGMGKGQYHLSEDLISCEIEDTLKGSTASINLLPNHPYTSYIFPGDWISIYMSSNADAPQDFGVSGLPESHGDNTRVFFGFVEAIRETSQVNATDGTMSVRFSISCHGAQSAFAETNVYFNRALGPKTLFGGFLPGLAQLTFGLPLSGTPATLPRAIAMAYLGHGGQFQMPSYYPKKGFGTLKEREERLAFAFKVALAVEESLGFAKVRGADGVQKTGLIERAMKQSRVDILAKSFASVVDFFSYVEDLYVDGRTVNTPFHEQAGSLWNLMVENSNPIMNECFLSLLPERDNVTGYKLLHGRVDEWGQRPVLTPCLVVRERPFAWKNVMLESDSGLQGLQNPKVNLGDVFFSDRSDPGKYKDRYQKRQSTGQSKKPDQVQVGFDSAALRGFGSSNNITNTGQNLIGGDIKSVEEGLSRSIRAVDRVKLPMQYIVSESLGFSHNDMFNFFMISQSKIPLQTAYQRYVLLLDGLVPIFYPESIKKYGLRLKELSTKFMYTGKGSIGQGKGLDFLVRCLLAYDHWYQHAAYYRAGMIGCRPILAARPGMVLDVSGPGREESFYIEGVTLSYSQSQSGSGGTFSQTFTVTRGQPSGFSDPKMRFPYAPPDPIKMFEVDADGKRAKEIPRPPLSDDDQPKILRKPDNMLTETQRRDRLELLIKQITKEYKEERLFKSWSSSVKADEQSLNRKLTSQEAYGYWLLVSPGSQSGEKVSSLYDSEIKERPLPPLIPVKYDRTYAGKAPYARKPWYGKVWTNARHLLLSALSKIGFNPKNLK